MATGDLNGNIGRLVDALAACAYPKPISARRVREGDATVFLPILHFALLDYSPHVAAYIHQKGYTLYARDDASFTDDCFKLACRHFPRPLKPHITPAQFLADGFVERKIIFVVEVLRQCIDIHRQAELRAQLTRKAVPPYSRLHHLEPRAASTWSDLTTEATATRSALPVNAALPPAAYPYDDRARVRSDVLYAVGGDAQELVPSAPTDELQAAWQFLSNAVALGSGATSALLQAKAAELQAATSSAAAAPVSNEVPQPRDASFSFLSTSTSGIPQPVRSARRADSSVTTAQAPPSTSALAHSMRAEEPDTNDSRSTLSGNPAAALASRTASAPACETNERAEPTDMHSSMRAMYNVAPDREGGSADADHAARRGAESSAQGPSGTPAYNSPSRLPVHRRRVGAPAPVVQPAAEAELSSRSVYYPAPGSRRHSWDEPPAQAASAPSSALPSFSAAAAADAADGGGMAHAWSAQHLHSMGDGAASASERGVDRSSASPAPALPPAPGCDAALPSASAMIITPSTHNAPAPSAPSALDVRSALPPIEPVVAGHMPRAGMASSAAWTTTHMAPSTGTTDAVVAQTLVQHVDDVSRAMLEGIAALSARLDALQNAATAVRTAQPHACSSSSSSSSVPVQLPPAAPYLSFMPSPMRMVGLPPSVMPAATAAPLPGSNEAAVAVSATAAAAAAPGASKPAPYAPAFGISSVGMDARSEQGSARASSQQLPALVAAYSSPSFPASAASSRRSSVGTDSLSAHAPPSLRMDMPDFVAALAARAAQTDQLLARAAVQLGSSAASSAGLGAGST